MKRDERRLRKGSATSVVIIAFAVLIYIVIPLGKAIFEKVFFHHIREHMVVILDSAIFAATANIDTEMYSEKNLSIMEKDVKEYIIRSTKKRKMQMIVLEKIDFELCESELVAELSFCVKSLFQSRENLLKIKGRYRFEILCRPDFE